MSERRAAIVDVDGTLVDSVYQHALSWHRAFSEREIEVPVWRCHRAIGMGGEKLVPELAGEQAEAEHGDALRERESELFGELIDGVGILPGAGELITELAERGTDVVLASSAEEENVERHIEDLGIGEAISGYTTSDDVEHSKPDPELVDAAIAKLDEELRDGAVMIGDSTWDVEAAARAGIDCVALLTGGFSESELRDAGAVAVFADPSELRRQLGDTPLG